MNYANLINNITTHIATNGVQAITAQVLQGVLVDMVGELGQSGALLGGVIDTSFVPDSTNDAQVVYIAEAPGTYTNFNGLVVGAGEVAFFYFDGNAWAKSSVDVLEVVNDLNSTATDKALSAAMGKQLQDSLTQAVNDLTTAIGNKADRQTTEQALNTLQNQINDKADTTYVNSQLATKADTASVNAALALKADTSAVNAALATKADTSALAAKADKVMGAVAGNMAALDADGNLVDSGVPASAVGDVADKIDKVHDAEVGNVPMFKADGGIEDGGVAADNIAEQDGYYETMVVGGAENLIGNDIVSSQFTRRKTGGSADVGTGAAIIKSIKGNTLVWNQLVDTGTTSVTIPSGHKYYAIINGVRSVGTSTGAAIAVTGGTDSVFDLTQMGLDSLTAAEFAALFPLNYYAYNSGSRLNLTATGLQTNGFNQWDEEWENGKYNTTTGEPEAAATQIRSKNYIPVFGVIDYYVQLPLNMGNLVVMTYDIDKNYLFYYAMQPGIRSFNSNVRYIRFYMTAAYGTTYNHDICINLSDANKNGTYEPYWSETKALPITTMTGKVNGEGESVVMLPEGARKAGSVFDETNGVKTWDRLLKIDLGSLNWGYNSSLAFFYTAPITDAAPATNWSTPGNLISDAYINVYADSIASSGTAPNLSIAMSPQRTICVKNTAYTVPADFKTAMNGVYIYAERATPIEYVNDTPLNLQYRVDNDGTETILPENTSTPTTSPIVADINYALNAIDTIRNLPQNYISKASMDAILTAFKTAGVITNYTLTWDATNQKYNCSITV